MRHGRSLPAVTLLAVVTLGACSGEPERPEGLSSSATSAPTTSLTGRAEQVAEIVEANTGSGLVPGIVVVLADDTGEESVARGVSDLESETPMRVDDRFRIASITKSMTAAVVLQLAQDAVLGLDDTVETWLPGLLAHGDEITVRQLLGHLSGLEEADDSGFVGRHGVSTSRRSPTSRSRRHPVTTSPTATSTTCCWAWSSRPPPATRCGPSCSGVCSTRSG